MKKIGFILVILLVTAVFFWPFLLKGLLPIPSDTIVGLYNPFRDFYSNLYPHGIPFKNFLLTDPVRQQYPWKELSMSILQKFQLPLWNPYSLTGTPLLANFQSSPFYILNLLFLFLPFKYGWSLLIFFQSFLSGLFLYLYLKNLKLSVGASLFGAITFSFCGFSIAWMEWGTIVNTLLWLPLILYTTDKIFANPQKSLKNKFLLAIVIAILLVFSFFAGHVQTFFYLFIFFFAYFLSRYLYKPNKKALLMFPVIIILFLIVAFIQWFPTLQFTFLSARGIDQNWQIAGWFIPWQNLIQFVVPDFFGNPATMNYWGVWNYGEFIGYVGIIPFMFAIFCLFYRKDRKTLFFGTAFFLSLIFSLPTFLAKIPYILNIPILASFQPTRLLAIADFSLAVLASLGIDYFYKEKKNIFYPAVFVGLFLALLWLVILNGSFILKNILMSDLLVSKSNLYFPTVIFIVSLFLLFISIFRKNEKVFYIAILLVLIIDLFRFGWKFTPFTSQQYLFPGTKTINFLKDQKEPFRIMATDSSIFPPNFSVMYRLQSIDGYDPLYILRYGELAASMGRNAPDIQPPFGFNRIITLENYQSSLVDLLNVKYMLTFDNVNDPAFKKVFEEGKTKVYENENVLPRTFFIGKTIFAKDKQMAINLLFDKEFPLKFRAVVENDGNGDNLSAVWSVGKTNIISYEENKVLIDTDNQGEGFLVLTDSFYPTWHAKIDGKETKIYRTDYNFRGIIVPSGKHNIEFYDSLF